MTTDRKNFDFRPGRGIIVQNWISGCSLSVRHLVWDQGQAGSTPVTRTKNPLKLTDFRGLFFAYCGAGFEDSYMNSMKTVTWIRWLIVIFTKLYYNWLTVGLCATKAAVWVLLPCGFLYEYLQFHLRPSTVVMEVGSVWMSLRSSNSATYFRTVFLLIPTALPMVP